jgi:diguanylate cyclase (GGDEF)-like protein
MLQHVTQHHNIWLVILAAGVCAVGSLTSFVMYGHVLRRARRSRKIWLALLGVCAGANIWATHFVAMLAHDTGLPTSYDPVLTAASFAVVVAVTSLGFALSLGARRVMAAAGGAVIGLGIAAMHFLGMQALVVPGIFQWNTNLVLLAICLGVGLSAAALLAFRQQRGQRALISAALLFAAAICALHFTAMAALQILPRADMPAPVSELDSSVLAALVAGVTALILLAGAAVALIDGRAIRESAMRTAELVEAAIEGLVIAADGVIVNVNSRALELCGRNAEDLIGKPVFGALLASKGGAARSGASRCFGASLIHAGGTVIPVEVVRRQLSGFSQGNEVYAIRDLRALEDAARQLAEANEQLRRREEDLQARNLVLDAALSNMSQGLCMYDAQQSVVISNERFATIYGLAADAIQPGMSLRDVVQMRIDNGLHAGPSPAAYLEERLTPLAKAEDSIHELNNGQIIAIARRPLRTGGWVTTHADITEQRRIEAQIAHLSRHDTLTGLLTRVSFRDGLDERLRSEYKRDRRLAVLMLGIDGFRGINDTLGHAVGDQLLKSIAQRLEYWTRRATILGRFGDDTFVLAEVVEHPGKDAVGLAARLQEELRKPFKLAGPPLEITATIGIAVSPADGKDAETLLQNAALALNRGKLRGRGTHHFFEPGMDTELRTRRTFELELAEAVAAEQFQLLYQPLVNLARSEMSGFEALVHWQHPVKGLLQPKDFLPVAEDIGLLGAIENWTLQKACAEAALWPNALTVAIGLSAPRLCSADLGKCVVSALASSGMAAERLQLEVSEKAVGGPAELVTTSLQQLHKLGVHITLKEFGSGFSSLSYLRRFPIHKVKFDRSLIADLPIREDGQAIIRMLTRVGAGMGVGTVIDGVETEDQLRAVREGGCLELQGGYFGAPKSAEDLAKLFTTRPAQKQATVA